MSRGLGSAQRSILSTLSSHPAGLSLRRLRRAHPRHLRRALGSLVERGAVVERDNVFRISGFDSAVEPHSKPAVDVACTYNACETMTNTVLQRNLNVRVDGELRAEVEAIAALMSRDGLRMKLSAVARCALVRGLRVMRDELTRAAGSSEVA